jgi:hypothetical protein
VHLGWSYYLYLEGHRISEGVNDRAPLARRLALLLINDHLLRKGRGYQLRLLPYHGIAGEPLTAGDPKRLREECDWEIDRFARDVRWAREEER